MSITNDAATTVRSAHEAFNLRDFARSRELTASDCVVHVVPTGQVLHGPEGMVAYLQAWVSAVPDARTTITSMVSDGQRVGYEFRGQGTQTGVFQSPMGDIPPSGRPIDLQFCEMWEVIDGKIHSANVYFDATTLMRQLGVIE